MDLFKLLEKKAKAKRKTIILPESYDPRVLKAAQIILKKKLAEVILINTGKALPIKNTSGLAIIDIDFSLQYLDQYLKIRRVKDPCFTSAQAKTDLKDPLNFSCMLLKNNIADGVVAGSVYSTGDVLKSAIRIIGLSKGNRTVSSFFLFHFPAKHLFNDKVFAYADCGVIPAPTPEQLSDIAIQTSKNFKKLTGIKPKTAFLSFSTKGSSSHASVDKVIKAYKITRKKESSLICDCELQFDAAFVPDVAKRKDPKGKIKGSANVFIFPDLNSGNIAYKITERIGGAFATGPIIQGLAKPVMDLSRGCNENDIVNMAVVLSDLV